MNIECGIVVQVQNKKILVESEPEGFCASCNARGSCSASGDTKKRRLWMNNGLGAAEDDRVTFGIKEESMIIGSALIYLTPVIFIIAGAVAGIKEIGFLEDIDLRAALGGFLGLVISFLIIGLVSRFFSRKESFTPQLLSIQKPDEK